jgi:hypothetical protein
MMPKLTRALSANQVAAARDLDPLARLYRPLRFMAGVRWTLARALLVCAVALTSYAGTTNYAYDVHGRLVIIAVPNGSEQSITTNSYDNAGNRQSVVVTTAETTPPDTPTNLTATAQAMDRIRLNWTPSLDVGGGPVSYYRVYRGGDYIASPNVPPFDDWPLTPSTTYSYTVAAVDPSGNVSTPSSSASATTLPPPPPPDTTPPSVPNLIQGPANSGIPVNLSWDASTDTGGSGLAGYEVFRDVYPHNNPSLLGTSSVASYSDSAAVDGTTYSYRVRAYDGAGNRSGLSNLVYVSVSSWITFAYGLNVLPEHGPPNGPYSCGEGFNPNTGDYNAWCAVGGSKVWDLWYWAEGGQEEWFAEGYRAFAGEMQVRQDRYGLP